MMPDRLLEDEVDLSPEERQESWHRDNLWELSSSDTLRGYALRMHSKLQRLNKKLINNLVMSRCLKMGIYDRDMHKAAPVSPYRHAATLAIRLLGRIMEMEQKVRLHTAGFFDNLLMMAYSTQD